MSFFDIVFYIVIGFIASVTGGFWGAGGGWLIVPALLIFGVPDVIAVGASLIQMIPTTMLTVFRQFRKIGWEKDGWGWTVAFPLCFFSFLGGFFGKPAGHMLENFFDGRKLHQSMYVILLAWIFVQTLIPGKTEGKTLCDRGKTVFSKYGASSFWGFLTGVVSSLLGIGGGIITRPVMKSILCVPEKETAMVARLAVFVIAVAGGSSYMADIFGGGGLEHNNSMKSLIIGLMLSIGGIQGFSLGAWMHGKVLLGGNGKIAHTSFALVALLVAASVICKIINHDRIGQALLLTSGFALTLFLFYITYISYKKAKTGETINEDKN